MLHIATALGAALAFTVGGIFMKPSHGLTRPIPTAAVLVLFAIGAVLMILSVESHGELGAAYVVVLGLETILAFAFGTLIFGEQANTMRIAGLVLLVAGMVLIEQGGTAETSDSALHAPAIVAEVR